MSHTSPHFCQPLLFPPIENHGVIGDRRTGALVAADGTLDWFCAPDYDGEPLFSFLLDGSGGYCRFGPRQAALGAQRYEDHSAVVLTKWSDHNQGHVELADLMVWPEEERSPLRRSQRVILRRITVKGSARVQFDLRTGPGLTTQPGQFIPSSGGAFCAISDGTLGLWTSFPFQLEGQSATADLLLTDLEEQWCAVGWNLIPAEWSVATAKEVFNEAREYWIQWSSNLRIEVAGDRRHRVCRSAITVQLLGHAHSDCVAAALTTSLPERLGGDRNYDYRYAWVRDASLSLALLARLGKEKEVTRYFDWLCRLTSTRDSPLMVCYRLDGSPLPPEEEVIGLSGYQQSRPVRRGNHASKQRQHGSLGFFADCARLYLDHGGEWKDEFWQLIRRAADYTCDHWQEPDSGVWELEEQSHFVASRVMSWVVLDRSLYLAQLTTQQCDISRWSKTRDLIHEEVMVKGWCGAKGSFRQRYGSDALDAAVLLAPLMGFLPPAHPRVLSTLDALARELTVNGLIHRFKPEETLSGAHPPIGEFEGAFLPAVFWHVHALALAGRCEQAEAILRRCESVAAGTGLFAEEIHAAGNAFLGNIPLVFAHVEYVRAVLALNEAQEHSRNHPTSNSTE